MKLSWKKSSKSINSYYRALFGLPRTSYIILSALLFLGIVYITLGRNSIPILIYYSILTITLIIYSRIVRTVFKPVRRILGLALATMIFSYIISLIFNDCVLGIVSSISMFVIPLIGLDGFKASRYIYSVTPSTLTLMILSMLNFITPIYLYKYLLIIGVLIAIDVAIYMYLSRYKVEEYSAPQLGTLFLQNWLESWTDIDHVFGDLGESIKVSPRIIGNDKISIVYTDIHYGPFSNIGSSLLPMYMERDSNERGRDVIILHGMGSHERNISSIKDTRVFVEQLIGMMEGRGVPQKYYGAFKIRGEDNWEVLGLVFSNISLLFISRPVYGIDDLPYVLQEEVEKRSMEMGLGDVVLIDSHNWEMQREFKIDGLRKLLDEALKRIMEIRSREPVDPVVKIVSSRVEASGIIGGVVRLIEISGVDARDRVLLIYFRGNNMTPYLRNEILSSVVKKTRGEAYVEVVTNDEHSETGVLPGVAYVPVQNSKEIVENIKAMVDKLSGMRGYNGLNYIRETLETRVLGSNAYRFMELLEKTYFKTAALLLSYLMLSPFLTYVLLKIVG